MRSLGHVCGKIGGVVDPPNFIPFVAPSPCRNRLGHVLYLMPRRHKVFIGLTYSLSTMPRSLGTDDMYTSINPSFTLLLSFMQLSETPRTKKLHTSSCCFSLFLGSGYWPFTHYFNLPLSPMLLLTSKIFFTVDCFRLHVVLVRSPQFFFLLHRTT